MGGPSRRRPGGGGRRDFLLCKWAGWESRRKSEGSSRSVVIVLSILLIVFPFLSSLSFGSRHLCFILFSPFFPSFFLQSLSFFRSSGGFGGQTLCQIDFNVRSHQPKMSFAAPLLTKRSSNKCKCYHHLANACLCSCFSRLLRGWLPSNQQLVNRHCSSCPTQRCFSPTCITTLTCRPRNQQQQLETH